MKKQNFHTDSGRLYRCIYRLSVCAAKQAKCENDPSPHPKPYPLTIKHTYTITKTASLALTIQSRRYIQKKLCYLHKKQLYIPVLCRIYGIPPCQIQSLSQKQADILHLFGQLLRQERDSFKAESVTNMLLNACKEQKRLALQFSNSAPTLPIHRQLMLRDIADEYMIAANIISQMLAVIFME